MSKNATTAQLPATVEQELAELRRRVEWLDGERRTYQRKLAEIEQRGLLLDEDVKGRERRIIELERQLTSLNSQLARVPLVDSQLEQFKEDLVAMLEQADKRRIEADRELDRLRRVEHETMTRELSEIRKELPPIGRLGQEMLLRQSEEARLANLLGVQQSTLTQLVSQVEQLDRTIAFFGEQQKQDRRHIAELQSAQPEAAKRQEAFEGRLELLGQSMLKLQSGLQAVEETQEILRGRISDWSEQVQIGEHERNQRLSGWQRTMDEHAESLERFTKEWVKHNNQYNETKTLVDSLKDYESRLEAQQREAMEVLRVETGRMAARWDKFAQEDARKWKNLEADAVQRQATVDRLTRQLAEQIATLEGALETVKQSHDQIVRIQSAQAEAVKKWPTTWLEEVQKAVEQNPDRRRQPTTVTSPDEPF